MKSSKKIIANIMTAILIGAIVYGVVKVAGIKDVSDIWNYAKRKSQEIKDYTSPDENGNGITQAIQKGIENAQNKQIQLPTINTTPTPQENKQESTPTEEKKETPKDNNVVYNGPKNGEAYQLKTSLVSKEESLSILGTLKIEEADTSKAYKRTEWKHWSKVDGRNACWNVRQEALYQQAVPNTVKLINKDKKEVSDVSQACAVSSGEWIDPYSGEKFTNPKDLDVDHIIALGYTARHGGNGWDSKKKEEYANDLADVLLVTSARENRSKSDKGPSEYMPPDDKYKCVFAKNYVGIANKYSLTITQKDKDTLQSALNKCGG